MVRARKSHEGDEENVKRGELPPAYSPKVGGNKYVIYVHYPTKDGDNLSRVLVLSMNTLYAASYFVKSLLGPTGTFEDRSPFGARESVVTDIGVIISMYSRDDLNEIMAYTPTEREAEWKDPSMYRCVMQLKYGGIPRGGQEDADGDTDGEDSGDRPSSPEVDDDGDLPKAAKGARKSRRDRRVHDAADDGLQKPRGKGAGVDVTGYISAGDIGLSLGEEARIIRGVLRALKLEKPAHGWSWPKKEAEAITLQIRGELLKGKKK